MKPSEPINRNRLLKIIAARLSVAAEREPLGQTVRSIMDNVSPHDRSLTPQTDDPSSHLPVPLGDVAAYVDGTIADDQTEQRITSEAVADEGLMLEIVMAVKSKAEISDEQPMVLPEDLRSRLISMGPSTSNQSIQELDPLDSVLPKTDLSPVATLEKPTETIEIRSDIDPRSKDRARQDFWKPVALVSLAIAATVLAFVSWQAISNPNESTPIAEEPTPKAPNLEIDSSPSETNLVEDLTPAPESVPTPAPGPIPNTVREPRTPDPMVAPSPEPMIVETEPKPVPDRPPPHPVINETAKPLVATWSQIDGLLLRSDLPRVPDAGSLSAQSLPKTVRDGTEITFVSQSGDEKLRLETLPLCRAEASLTEGGTLVVADDTRMEVTRGGAIDLRYGAIAIVDVGRETLIRLGSSLRQSVSVRSPAGASMVVRRTATGMEFDVVDQPIRIGDETFANQTVRVNAITQKATPISEAPKRLPKWTRERTHRIELGRNVLAQLSKSDDVGVSIRQLIQSGSVRGEQSMLLRKWFVASRRDYLMRLIASDDMLLRETALMYLRETRPNDPRHAELWRALRSKSQNQRSFAMIRALFADYWAGKRPATNRRDGLVMMLASSDPSVRATGDFLLRSFYGKGPAFTLNTNARTQQRMIGNWRVVINRIDGN